MTGDGGGGADRVLRFDAFQKIDGHGPAQLRMRCPACRHTGVFETPTGLPDAYNGQGGPLRKLAVIRRCPNPECYSIVFAIRNLAGDWLRTYPPELVDFDTTDLPTELIECLEEAIAALGAGAVRASAIMVRRTLEVLCDLEGATGANLKSRLEALKAKVSIPQALLDGLDDLRLLGNDAAHVKAKDYEEIGEAQVVAALEVTKEILKGLYQHDALVARLAAFKRPT